MAGVRMRKSRMEQPSWRGWYWNLEVILKPESGFRVWLLSRVGVAMNDDHNERVVVMVHCWMRSWVQISK